MITRRLRQRGGVGDLLAGFVREGSQQAQTRDDAHAATYALVTTRGYGDFTVREVAALAGMNESTIYRRWRAVGNIVLDVADRRIADAHSQHSGTLHGDLVQYVAALFGSLTHPVAGDRLLKGVIGALVAAGTGGSNRTFSPASAKAARDFCFRRVEEIHTILTRHESSHVTVLDVLDKVVAPLMSRRIFGYRQEVNDIPDMVGALLRDVPAEARLVMG